MHDSSGNYSRALLVVGHGYIGVTQLNTQSQPPCPPYQGGKADLSPPLPMHDSSGNYRGLRLVVGGSERRRLIPPQAQ